MSSNRVRVVQKALAVGFAVAVTGWLVARAWPDPATVDHARAPEVVSVTESVASHDASQRESARTSVTTQRSEPVQVSIDAASVASIAATMGVDAGVLGREPAMTARLARALEGASRARERAPAPNDLSERFAGSSKSAVVLHSSELAAPTNAAIPQPVHPRPSDESFGFSSKSGIVFDRGDIESAPAVNAAPSAPDRARNH